MDQDQSQALNELTRNVMELVGLFADNQLETNKVDRAYQLVLETRANANLIRSYVTERMEQETVIV
jgi:hypothetical protein